MGIGDRRSKDQEPAETIGLVGVGLLGQALASRFVAAGLSVIGWDVRPEARRAVVELGGAAAESAADALGCRRVVLCLPDDGVVAGVLEESGEALPLGATVIDTTTGDPLRQANTGSLLAERGIAYLDATVGGSSRHVREGIAVVMAGGNAEAFDACRDLFASFSSQAIHVGECGSGSKMKLVVNLVLGLNRAALAEGLALARGFDLEPGLALQCLQAGPAWSRAMDDKGEKMIEGRFEPQARLSQHLKDVKLILEAGQESGVRLPLSRLHRQVLEAVEAAGFGEDDNSAVIRAWGIPGNDPLIDGMC